MLPLIEQGYLYIAQPPLYKVKVGKTSKYLKDDSELKTFLFDWAGEHTTLTINTKTIPMTEWKTFLHNLLQYDTELTKVSNHFEISKYNCHNLVKFLNDITWEKGKYDINQMIEKLQTNFPDYTIDLEQETDEESEMAVENGVKTKRFITFKQLKKAWEIPYSFFKTEETAKLLELYKPLNTLESSEWTFNLIEKNKQKTKIGILNLEDTIVKIGKSLMTVQRYKGLGEMNPEQLWETTMDPKNRTLLQVSIEDALKADQWFVSLMGDVVADRKNYIEKHAHFVRNLDI
jgi:DNA gyrase subunit B